MLTLGAFAFAAPWVLAALAGLPILWWLLRVTPPSPKLVRFPAIRLLLRLQEKEDTPARTPWWLLLLRILIVLLLVVGLAHPLMNPEKGFEQDGPLVIAIDNGWSAAPNWQTRQNRVFGTAGYCGARGPEGDPARNGAPDAGRADRRFGIDAGRRCPGQYSGLEPSSLAVRSQGGGAGARRSCQAGDERQRRLALRRIDASGNRNFCDRAEKGRPRRRGSGCGRQNAGSAPPRAPDGRPDRVRHGTRRSRPAGPLRAIVERRKRARDRPAHGDVQAARKESRYRAFRCRPNWATGWPGYRSTVIAAPARPCCSTSACGGGPSA